MSELIRSRAEFQQMAEERLAEAKALLDVGKWSGAYYLAGYAVELGLKAYLIKMPMETDAFPEKDFSNKCYVRNVGKLLELAGLKDRLKAEMNADQDLKDNWTTAKDWSEEKRYHQIEKVEAENLYTAIADGTHGVFAWIKAQW